MYMTNSIEWLPYPKPLVMLNVFIISLFIICS